MVEYIEEELQDYYKDYNIEVEYLDIRQYLIKINNIKFVYKWKYFYTNSVNIENIKEIIKKMI